MPLFQPARIEGQKENFKIFSKDHLKSAGDCGNKETGGRTRKGWMIWQFQVHLVETRLREESD